LLTNPDSLREPPLRIGIDVEVISNGLEIADRFLSFLVTQIHINAHICFNFFASTK